MTVVHLADISGSAVHDSPAHVLETARRRIESGEIAPTRAFIILLDDRDGRYDINWNQAGLSMSQAIALLEVAKATCLEEMGY